MFIALEGPDGAGKTTLCSLLATRLEATPYATPPKKYREVRTKIDKNSSAEECYKFYRDGIYHASEEIAEILKRNGKIVCDRYWLTTYTYHQIMGVDVSKEDFQYIVIPILTIILSLNHEVQLNRMIQRGLSVGDRKSLDKQKDISAAFFRNALDFNIPFVVIDTQRFLQKLVPKSWLRP